MAFLGLRPGRASLAKDRIEDDDLGCKLNPFEVLMTGDIEVLNRAIEQDPELASARDQNGISLLMMALYRREDEFAESLAGRLPALDVFEAAAMGRVDLLESLLPVDRAPEPFAGDGFTPLHLAAYFRRLEVARWLLEKGADPNCAAENPSHVRPLHSAVAANADAMVDLLLSFRADPDVRQAGGWTPLQAACHRGASAIARRLLAAGADPSLRADDGRDARALLPRDSDPAAFGLGP